MFLDTLKVAIKLAFKKSGNNNTDLIKHSIKCLLNKETLELYKQKIHKGFFNALECNLLWMRSFRAGRDELVHKHAHFFFTNTPHREIGYEIMDMSKVLSGSETVKAILPEIEGYVGNLTTLLEYLSLNLSKEK
jgi:hypothetical protein